MDKTIAAAALTASVPAGAAGAAGRGAGPSERIDADGDGNGDGDGRITRAEARSAAGAHVGRVDANADGRPGRQEITTPGHARAEGRLAKRFESLDASGDGALARTEFAGGAAGLSGRLDGDAGARTRDEVASGIRRSG